MTYLSRTHDRQWYVTRVLEQLHKAVKQDFSGSGDDDRIHAALTCALPAIVQAPSGWRPWLLASQDSFTCELVQRLHAAAPKLESLSAQVATWAGRGDRSYLWHLYELLIGGSRKERKTRGVYYTPPAVARYVVAQAVRAQGQRCGAVVGRQSSWACRILEPACGSGAFIAALIEYLHSSSDLDQQGAAELITNLIAIDISPVAIFLSRLRTALLLQAVGIELGADLPQPQMICGDALAGPTHLPALRQPIGIVLGNPPFASLSTNDQPWIQKLIRGDEEHAGYFAIDGDTLGERKTWLHDDYVKFLRLAQWCIEQNGSGVVSLVTNQGWLDNATFRIARQQLMRTFDQIDVVDLHGNAKRHEASPTGERDENVFGIAQGIALVTLTRSPHKTDAQVTRADLWGSRATKLERLSRADAEPLPTQPIVPLPPWYTFAEQPAELPPEYRAAPLLTELMPVNSTVPVTARDYFVIARTRQELEQRLVEFCDTKIPDDEIRRKYFQRTRSNRYEPGDTRGWKLPAARRTLMNEANPATCIRCCLYRPFVWRYIVWHPAMIDWPRNEFTRHLLEADPTPRNLALLTRRQSVAGREANFFWITDCLPLDGVIRSDNRGSESFFPLWLVGESPPVANFAADWLRACDPRSSLAYLYALFHSPTYRTRYASGVAMEFPRVLRPPDSRLFHGLATLGEQLIELHLTNPHEDNAATPHSALRIPHSSIDAFHVGTYNVCRKWLQMEGESTDSIAYLRLRGLIARTLELQGEIDDSIGEAGGFPVAFKTC